MNVVFEKSVLSGTVKAPPSKSAAHRLIAAAALSGGVTEISGVEYSEDVCATLDCAEALGAVVTRGEGAVIIDGCRFLTDVKGPLFCRESGSTLRFFIPLALLTGREVTFCGSARLMERPLGVYEKLTRELGGTFRRNEGSLTVSGALTAREYTVEGGVSSQFVTGLIFALCRLGGGGIYVVPPFESRPYVEMTSRVCRLFGAEVELCENDVFVRSAASPARRSLAVEGDWSNAAFLEAFSLLGGDVKVTGLDENSAQGDRVYREHFASLEKGTPEIDLRDTPDLAPVLFALAAAKNGAVFRGTRRLADKESDRAAVMARELSKFGARVTVGDDFVRVYGGALHAPETPVEGSRDHRVAMANSLLLTLTGGELCGAEAVKKSFPSYFETIKRLGAVFTADGERNET